MAYIYSSFWTWAGTMCLIAGIFNGIASVIAAAHREREVHVSQVEGCITVKIKNAAKADVDTALADILQIGKETETDD